jgi:hypothetical protein
VQLQNSEADQKPRVADRLSDLSIMAGHILNDIYCKENPEPQVYDGYVRLLDSWARFLPGFANGNLASQIIPAASNKESKGDTGKVTVVSHSLPGLRLKSS